MKWILFVLATVISNLLTAQDLTGIWRGSFNSSEKIYELLNTEDRYKFEVQIDNQDKTLHGVTYSYKTTVFYGKAVATGTINPKTGKVMLQETKIVELKMQGGSSACIMTCFLQYSKNGNDEFLEGKYSSYNERDSSFCGRGTVLLRKVATSDFYKEPFVARREEENLKKKNESSLPKKTIPPPVAKTKKTPPPPVAKTKKTPPPPVAKTKKTPAPIAKTTGPKTSTTKPPVNNTHPDAIAKNEKKQPQPESKITERRPMESAKADTIMSMPPVRKRESFTIPPPLATRSNELVKSLVVNTKEVTVDVYDNGAIDHDTISLYLDKKLVISKQMLTTAPIRVKIKLDENNAYHELVLVAENLGDIPPNTSLMVVKAGDKQYEVHISSTEQKNAVIIFKYEK
jgi:hypothetical protein